MRDKEIYGELYQKLMKKGKKNEENND
jgi:hypothetical protein